MQVKPSLRQEFISILSLQRLYLQVKQLENADERIKLTNELLSGIKVISVALYDIIFPDRALRVTFYI